MSPARSSGITLSQEDVAVVLGMEARGDRNHDIAAWFGVNQGRIAEAKNGEYGNVAPAAEADLPPSGAPGIKGRRARAAIELALNSLQSGDVKAAILELQESIDAYDTNEP